MAKTERLNIRVTEEQHELLRRAAEANGQTVSDYVLSHVLADAHDDLADRRVLALDAPAWNELAARLDRQPVRKPELDELLDRKAPWEEPSASEGSAGNHLATEESWILVFREQVSDLVVKPLAKELTNVLDIRLKEFAEKVRRLQNAGTFEPSETRPLSADSDTTSIEEDKDRDLSCA